MPTAPVSVAVALADKLDTLSGFWAIDEKPTGSKDPFALRRAALGVIRLVIDNDLNLSLSDTFSKALNVVLKLSEWRLAASEANADKAKQFEHQVAIAEGVIASVLPDLLSFFHDRLKVYLKDQGVRHDIIDACIAMPQNDDLTLLVKRARALAETLKTDDGENLIQGFKRANNILTQAEQTDGVEYSYGADPKFAETDEEHALFTALDTAEAKITPAMDIQDFTTAMAAMASLRTPIDAFFEGTQINTDNGTVRRNRLNLLSRIRTLCLSVADLTKIDG
ncbi:glycine--tRNA ligase subunit beta [Tateyamaria sp.]|uniref:glycine--tRNA ligase subunit beta n=1 Tax=Tateyamaria sp. TaxID=1929288 RepID=UPI0039B9163C